MAKFLEKAADGTYVVSAPSYRVAVHEHTFEVYVAENRFCTLDVRTAVPQTSDALEEVAEHESVYPTLVDIAEKPGEVTFTWSGKSDLWEKKTSAAIFCALRIP